MRRRHAFAAFLHRLLAGGGAALVLALTVAAASPQLHDWLHASDGSSGDDGCAVTLFASGVALPLGAVALAAPSLDWHEQAPVAVAEIFLAAPRYLHQPERGPPVS
jgi:hypothetical protein